MDGAGRWLQSDEVDGSLCATTGQGLEHHVNLVPNFCDYEFALEKKASLMFHVLVLQMAMSFGGVVWHAISKYSYMFQGRGFCGLGSSLHVDDRSGVR